MYKNEKSMDQSQMIMTPLHLACKESNGEAIRILTEKHNYDMNILLDNKSAVYELISNSQYVDVNILNYLLRTSSPDINSGCLLPLNYAISRGN